MRQVVYGFKHSWVFVLGSIGMTLRIPGLPTLSMVSTTCWSVFLALWRSDSVFWAPYFNIVANLFFLYFRLASRPRQNPELQDLIY